MLSMKYLVRNVMPGSVFEGMIEGIFKTKAEAEKAIEGCSEYRIEQSN